MNSFYLNKAYYLAKSYVIACGYESELKWQQNIIFEETTETDFLRELAWVILSAGMNEKVIRKHFPNISLCFYDWESARKIIEMKKFCYEFAMQYFKNEKKISAIIYSSEIINKVGFIRIKEMLRITPYDTLLQFPYIGSITVFHLAKNIGLPFAKADRHLSRISSALGYADVQCFCGDIAKSTGDDIQVVDIVLWRFATLRRDYVKCFKDFVFGNSKF